MNQKEEQSGLSLFEFRIKKNPEHQSRYEWYQHGKWSNMQMLGVMGKIISDSLIWKNNNSSS